MFALAAAFLFLGLPARLALLVSLLASAAAFCLAQPCWFPGVSAFGSCVRCSCSRLLVFGLFGLFGIVGFFGFLFFDFLDCLDFYFLECLDVYFFGIVGSCGIV